MKSRRITILGDRTTVRASPWFRPYVIREGRRRCALREYGGGAVPGVYFIRDRRSGRVVYIGHSKSNLVKTLYRHFQAWEERDHVHATYDPSGPWQVRFIVGMGPAQAVEMERQLIQRHQPRDNGHKYAPRGWQPPRSEDAIDRALRDLGDFPF